MKYKNIQKVKLYISNVVCVLTFEIFKVAELKEKSEFLFNCMNLISNHVHCTFLMEHTLELAAVSRSPSFFFIL